MSAVGIRELRQRASELLRRVEQGETIEVTDRGRRVAILAPVPDGSAYERLCQLGEIEPATEDLDDLAEPLDLGLGIESPSSVLRRLREDER